MESAVEPSLGNQTEAQYVVAHAAGEDSIACEIVASQQWYRVVCFAVVLQMDSINVNGVGWQREWGVLGVPHPGIDESNCSIIGLNQARWVVQSASFVEEQGKIGGLDSIDTTLFFGPNACNPSEDESGDVRGDGRSGFVDCVDIGMHQEISTNDTLIISMVLKHDAFCHMFSKADSMIITTGPWAVTMALSATLIFPQWQIDDWRWHGSSAALVVAAHWMILGLTIGAAEAISLEGMTILAVEVCWVLVHVSKLLALEAGEVDSKVGKASGTLDDWELARDKSIGVVM
uniref:Uncharacterized protein n=1 Tax=Romanomermis culicivorax TaxID=13658 RepID=A0A915K4W2_ROMCU